VPDTPQARLSYYSESAAAWTILEPHLPVLAVYSIQRDPLAIQVRECQKQVADGLFGQHRPSGTSENWYYPIVQ
jgi:hypothetical protein